MADVDFVALPLILREGHWRRCSLRESISYSVGLILNTRYGILDYDPEYGCPIWDHEFADLYTINRADLRGRLRHAIGTLEPRLTAISIDFEPVPNVESRSLGIRVKVTGYFKDDGDEQRFEAAYILG